VNVNTNVGPLLTVLVVDDSKNDRETMGRIAEEDGFRVVFAQDGNEALRVAKAERPDMILLDTVMPRMNGFEVLRRLKQDPATRDIPVVLVSSKAPEEADKIWATRNGAAAHATKSFSRKTLAEIFGAVR
jgi:twitching motility two-component system response regulator PilH